MNIHAEGLKAILKQIAKWKPPGLDGIQLIEETMETWRVELTTGGKSSAEVKIQRGIFQGDTLSSLLFIIVMMPHNDILNKCTAGYKLSKSQEKIHHLMYMDNIKLFAKIENIESRYRNGVWRRKICYASNEKQQKTHDRRNRPTK